MASPEQALWQTQHKREALLAQYTIGAYSEDADGYEVNTTIDPSDHHPARLWIDHVLAVLDQRPEIKHLPVLEIGSGTGRDANYFEAQGLTVQRTDRTPEFVEALEAKGHDVRCLDALTSDFDGPYSMVFANGVFPHFSDKQVRHVKKKVFRSLVADGVFAYSLKVTDAKKHWKQGTIEGWDVMIPPDDKEVPTKLRRLRYYYIRHPVDARQLALEENGRSVDFTAYNTERSQWLGVVACKDGINDIPLGQTRHSMPYVPLHSDLPPTINSSGDNTAT